MIDGDKGMGDAILEGVFFVVVFFLVVVALSILYGLHESLNKRENVGGERERARERERNKRKRRRRRRRSDSSSQY